MKKLALIVAVLATLSVSGSATTAASAAGFGIVISSGSGSRHNLYVVRPAYGYVYSASYGGWHRDLHNDVHHGSVWHDTSHLHYRRPRLLLHGNQIHYLPGRFEVHRTGHWDQVHW